MDLVWDVRARPPPEAQKLSFISTMQSVAGKLLRSRALQCSFTSVFHLRKTGMTNASYVENVFIGAVGVPLMILGVTGLAVSISNNWTWANKKY
jgi:hypothetical protein